MHHFSAGGLYNGLLLLVDDETGTYWDHVVGEGLHGPLAGVRLPTWPVKVTTVAAALRVDPGLNVLQSQRRLLGGWLDGLLRWEITGKGLLPFFFHRTMGKKDGRRPLMEHGLGVIVEGEARFYPVCELQHGLTDAWGSRRLYLSLGEVDRIPEARWEDGALPMQIFTRWYGFSFAYPGCRISSHASVANAQP